MTRPRQIVAFGGGGFSMEAGNPLLDDYVLGLATASGRDRPRVCFLPTASGDADHYIVRFYRHFHAGRCEPSHVSLFRRDRGVGDVREHLLAQDLVYVGGGSVVSLLGVWRAHGVDAALREAWEAGVVMAGLSAGSLCWFAEAMSGYHGDCARVPGVGFLPCSNAVHYDKEPQRRPAFHAALLEGMRGGFAAEDGAALHFVGEELARVVTSRPGARAFRVDAVGGEVVEIALPTTYLGVAAEPALVA
jgi:dipeptidase E